ncbi:hypothetical protein FoTM2_012499 [Fusarium oxysporum f. sp. vasinfectum]|nr:hypothetical protein FoTM2_012499 [Fusarium oxysporum f. sp. vasinfectum]
MAPFDEPHYLRWQRQAKRAFGATLPDWTIADDSDDYDVHIMRKRTARPRRRRSNVPTSSGEPEVMINILREPYAKRTDTVDPATEKQKQDVEGGDGMHSNVHKILLGVGSVGGFLFLLGIGFLIWKFYSRKQSPKKPAPIDDMNFDKPSRFENLVSKVPFLGSRYGHKGWYTIEDPSYSPPSYSPPLAEKTRPQSPLFMPKQSDNFLTVPSLPFGVYRTSGDRRTGVTNYDIDAVSPTSTTFVESAVEVQVVARHDPKDSLSTPYKPQQHKRIPSTTPYAYDVGRRQTGVSELSSISSGFGDGDIVVTPTTQTVQSVPSRPEPSRQPTWKSTNSVGRRDTVSTVASVDTRPRFRSVNSWVKQQNGQLRRAQRQQENSLDSDAPPVPPLAPPPEQDFRYMLQDDERPRPVEMV